MPKKAQKNAFFYFMLDFKEEQRKKGINYGNLVDVSKAADPEWRNASAQVRARYEARAKHEKQLIAKFTSTGIPMTDIQNQQKEIQDAIEFEIQDIKNMVKTKAFNKSILDEDIYLIDVNYFCKASTKYVIGESTVLRFNLRSGFIDYYHEMVKPGNIPIGYTSDVKQGSIDLGLDMPDETGPKSNYMAILANIVDYLKNKDPSVKTLPPLYTMPEKVLAVQDFIIRLCQKCGEDECLFRIYKLDTLFYHLIDSIKSRSNEGFAKESLALDQLRKDTFKYNPGLGCEHHESIDKAVKCTTSRTKRWAFTILDSCCPLVGIPIVPGQHVPVKYDVENASAQVRARYEARAKHEKQLIAKFTSTGIPMTDIQNQQKEIQDAIEFEIQDIKNMVKTKAFNKSILDEDIYLIDVNYFCKASTKYVIGESTVLRFNLRSGFIDYYHEMVKPGNIPIGYTSDVKQGSIDLGLDMPDETGPKSNYMAILANIVDYLKNKDPSVKTLPPLYTMPEKVLAVQDFIIRLCQKCGEDECLFRIYKLDTLFYHLIDSIKSRSNEGFAKESLALDQLRKDTFKYNPGLGCEHHESIDKAVKCTTSRTKRWAFTILDSCCPLVGIPIVPGQHVPVKYDVEDMTDVKFKDSKNAWSGPTIAGFAVYEKKNELMCHYVCRMLTAVS